MGDPDIILVLHCFYTYIVHYFQIKELHSAAGSDVIAISSPGALQIISDCLFRIPVTSIIYLLHDALYTVSNKISFPAENDQWSKFVATHNDIMLCECAALCRLALTLETIL